MVVGGLNRRSFGKGACLVSKAIGVVAVPSEEPRVKPIHVQLRRLLQRDREVYVSVERLVDIVVAVFGW